MCNEASCTKYSIQLNAESGLGSFHLGKYFKLALSYNKTNCALCEKYGTATTAPIDWEAESGHTNSLQNRLNAMTITAGDEYDSGITGVKVTRRKLEFKEGYIFSITFSGTNVRGNVPEIQLKLAWNCKFRNAKSTDNVEVLISTLRKVTKQVFLLVW